MNDPARPVASAATATARPAAAAPVTTAPRPAAPSAAAPQRPVAQQPRLAVAPRAATAPVATATKTPAASVPKPANVWGEFFRDWPDQIPRRGIVVNKLNDASPFKGFMLRGEFVLLERTSPDSLGGRFLVMPFDEISTLKFTDPLKEEAFASAGFEGHFAK